MPALDVRAETDGYETITPLDLAWEEINALGGPATDDYGRGANEAISAALDIIEKLGGSDPLIKRHTPKTA